MRRGVLVRFLILLVFTIAALFYLTPTVVGELPSWWGGFLPTDRIHLGLDLQGGSHLILEVKVDKGVENTVQRVKEDLRRAFREKGVTFNELERLQDNRLQLKVPATGIERVRDLLKSEFPILVVVSSRSSAGAVEFLLALDEREIRSVREYAVDQSLETIRNRIADFDL